MEQEKEVKEEPIKETPPQEEVKESTKICGCGAVIYLSELCKCKQDQSYLTKP